MYNICVYIYMTIYIHIIMGFGQESRSQENWRFRTMETGPLIILYGLPEMKVDSAEHIICIYIVHMYSQYQ